MKKLLTLTLALTLCAFGAHADCARMERVPAETLDLQSVIEFALCRNPNTAASFYGVRQARMQRYGGMAAYLPTIDASVSARQQYRRGEWSDTMTGASLSASWLIFDFGRRESEMMALNSIWRATGLEHSSAVQNFIFDIISAYYGLLIANAEVASANEMLSVARAAKSAADTRFRAGAVARADVLRADTTLAQRQLELQRAQGTQSIARGRLLFLMSFPQDGELNIADMPLEFGARAEQRNISEMIEYAVGRRGSIRAREEQMNAAWHRRNAAFLRNMPSISVAGTLSYDFNPDFDMFGAGPNNRFDGSSISIRASMPIFTGFAATNNIRAMDAAYEQSRERLRAQRDNVALDIWQAYQNYITALQVLESSDALLASSIESERVVAGMYRVGRADMLAWQTAQADLTNAQRQNITARYDLFVRRAGLALAMGEIHREMGITIRTD